MPADGAHRAVLLAEARARRVHLGGPARAGARGAHGRLEAKGYVSSTIEGYVRAARHVTYCIEHRQIARRELTLAGLRRFAREHRRSCRCPHPEKAASANFYSCMAHLLPPLQRAGVAPGSPGRVPFQHELGAYDTFMKEAKGLCDDTRALHIRSVSTVLRALMPRGRFDPSRLTPAAMQAYVSALAETRSPHTVGGVVTAIRDRSRASSVMESGRSAPLRASRRAETGAHLG